MSGLIKHLKTLLRNVDIFIAAASGLKLRRYQKAVALAVVDSVIHQRGLSFVVMFPRQSGKNELQAQIETYLLTLYSKCDAEMIKVSPTWKPQSLNAMRRLERVLNRNLITKSLWSKESGYIYRVGSARIFFLSGDPAANIVGATASTLLQVDEAQDVQIAKYDKDIAPMAASTNATRVFWGTAWTSRTLLARELRAARRAEAADGIRRSFVIDANIVAEEVPAYGQFAADQVFKLGRNHPLVKTQFFSEEIDAEGGMFPPARRELMQGNHERLHAPKPGEIYAFLLDVAGKDEGAAAGTDLENPERDYTALTIVRVDLSTLDDSLIAAQSYQVVNRLVWQGVDHAVLYAQLRKLGELWQPKHWVVDSTGVGAGLTSFLETAFPEKVIPFLFSAKSKSKLGWGFLAVIETGRFQDWLPEADPEDDLQQQFEKQLEYCQLEVHPGPERRLSWAVPNGTRDPATGEVLHDDLVISAAMCCLLDKLSFAVSSPTAIIQGRDPLADLDQGF